MRSVDCLRGLAALFFFGGSAAVPVLYALQPSPLVDELMLQLSPSVWHGLTMFDFLFPTFLFVSGLSICLAACRWQANGRLHPAQTILGRTVLLFTIGLAIDSGWLGHWPHLRLTGWFQQLALCYAAAALLYQRLEIRYLIALWCVLLVDYGALLLMGPQRSELAYAMVGNIAQQIDTLVLPGRKYFGNWDPQGALTTIPAFLLTLAGVIAGNALFQRRGQAADMPLLVGIAGMLLVLGGTVATSWIPLSAHLGTPSFVCIATGVLVAMAGLLHGLLDHNGATRVWAMPLIATGRNVLLVVLVARLVPFESIRVGFGELTADWMSAGSSSLLVLAGELTIVGLAVQQLYARRWFLTVSWPRGQDARAAMRVTLPASLPESGDRPCGETPAN